MKKIKLFVVITTMCLLVAGCSSNNSTIADNSADSTKIKELEDEIDKLKKENETLKAEISNTKSELSEEEETPEEESDIQEKETIVKKGSTIKTDELELTINKVELTYDVLPDDISDMYNHYEADPGNVYINMDVDIKNLQKKDLPCDEIMTVTADYNNGFTYESFETVEDSITGFTYSNISSINPLETIGMRFLIECPEEVEKETNNSLFLTFKLGKKTYKYIIR